jgi:16S rRNA (cytosine967-C5)-methyltransferase
MGGWAHAHSRDRRTVVSLSGDAGLTISGKVGAARGAALQALAAADRGRRLDLALEQAARGLSPQDQALARELAFGVTRLRGRLDHRLSGRVDRGLEALHATVLNVLRLATYELFEMGGVPAYATVSQGVEAVRAAGQPRAAGFVNAVLRRMADDAKAARAAAAPEGFPALRDDPAGHLATWGSHPRWLVERWLARWSATDVARLVAVDNQVPPLTLVPLDPDVDRAIERWQQAGFEARVAGAGSGAVEVIGSSPVQAMQTVPSFVQDAAAAWVGAYAAVPQGARAADLCAAPGGKAMYMARSASWVVAADPSAKRLALVAQNRDRTGLPLHLVQADAAHVALRDLDVVLVDAPCTGTGTLRRHPDARWRLTPDAPAHMAGIQLRLLRGAADAVAPGGLLVYSTCTLESEENDALVEAFLAERDDFEVEPPTSVQAPIDEKGYLRVLPQQTGTDGAFAARLRRRSGG